MAGWFALPLAEVKEFREREVISREVKETVKQHGSMTGGKDEPVPVEPGWMAGVVLQEPGPEHISHGSSAHGHSGVP